MPNAQEIVKVQKAVGMLTQLLSFVEGIDVMALTTDQLFDLMYESKEIATALTAIVKAGRTRVLDEMLADGVTIIKATNGEFRKGFGSARLSAKLFDDNLLKEGLALDRIKALKKASMGNQPVELDMVKAKA